MDISKQLHAYEVEYHVLQDETVDAVLQSNDSDRLDKLEKTNNQLKKQNMDRSAGETTGGKLAQFNSNLVSSGQLILQSRST